MLQRSPCWQPQFLLESARAAIGWIYFRCDQWFLLDSNAALNKRFNKPMVRILQIVIIYLIMETVCSNQFCNQYELISFKFVKMFETVWMTASGLVVANTNLAEFSLEGKQLRINCLKNSSSYHSTQPEWQLICPLET